MINYNWRPIHFHSNDAQEGAEMNQERESTATTSAERQLSKVEYRECLRWTQKR